MNRRGGYTLIEAAIVVTIVTILAVLAVPEFRKWNYHIKFTGFVRDVFTVFQQGRQRAITSGVAHTVEVDASANVVRLRRVSDGALIQGHGNVTAPGGIAIVSGSNVTFNANGTASSAGNVNIRNLSSAADNSTIVVTLGTGRVKIQ